MTNDQTQKQAHTTHYHHIQLGTIQWSTVILRRWGEVLDQAREEKLRVYNELILKCFFLQGSGILLSEVIFQILADHLYPIFMQFIIPDQQGAVETTPRTDIRAHIGTKSSTKTIHPHHLPRKTN